MSKRPKKGSDTLVGATAKVPRVLRTKAASAPEHQKEIAPAKSSNSADVRPSVAKKVKKTTDGGIDVKVKDAHDMEDMVWEPKDWRTVWENILVMRRIHSAPVDSMGCESCPDPNAMSKIQRFQTLVSLMLSSQTKDQVTFVATQRLIEHGLTVENVLNTSDEKLGELIYPVGFWKKKVKYIKDTCQILKEQYDSDIPSTLKDLCKLPGVGPKMANLAMSVAWDNTVGIAVDTHVHRISNRLGWVPKPTKEPEQTRVALESWLPKTLWLTVNLDLVGFGQTICQPVQPKCSECLNCHLCPTGKENLRNPGKARSPKKKVASP